MSKSPLMLLQLPNLIIKGRYYTVMSYSNDIASANTEYECIELDFTILVNGKMTNFQNSFVITRQIDGHEDSEYTLQDFGEWYLIVRILMSLGYYISEDVRYEHQMGESNSIIKKWINMLRGEDEVDYRNVYTHTVGGLCSLSSMQSGSTICSGTECMKTAIN